MNKIGMLLLIAVAFGLAGCRSRDEPPDFQVGEPVEWPAPTPPEYTPPTIDREEWRGIWTPSPRTRKEW